MNLKVTCKTSVCNTATNSLFNSYKLVSKRPHSKTKTFKFQYWDVSRPILKPGYQSYTANVSTDVE